MSWYSFTHLIFVSSAHFDDLLTPWGGLTHIHRVGRLAKHWSTRVTLYIDCYHCVIVQDWYSIVYCPYIQLKKTIPHIDVTGYTKHIAIVYRNIIISRLFTLEIVKKYNGIHR